MATADENPKKERPYQSEWKRRRRLGTRGWVAIFGVAVVGAAVFGILTRQQPTDDYPYRLGGPAGNSPGAATTAANANSVVDLKQPYAKTPAASWSDAADGIVLPVAAPVGSWSAAQVGTAEQAVRQTLIDGHLDNRVLVEHDTSVLLASLAPGARADATSAMAKPDTRDDGGLATQLVPGSRLLPVPIKVNGTMSAPTGDHGNLVVNTNYVFAYAFAPTASAHVGESGEIVAIVHIDTNFTMITGTNYRSTDHGIWPGGGQSYVFQMSCDDAANGYLGPSFDDLNGPFGNGSTENPDALYDPKHPMNIPDDCPADHHN